MGFKTRVEGSPNQIGKVYKEDQKAYPYGARRRGSGTVLMPVERSVDSMKAPAKKPVDLNGKYFAGKKRGLTNASVGSSPHVNSPSVGENAKPSVVGSGIPGSYDKWEHGGMKRDLAMSNQKLLDPTNPEHVQLWLKDPGKYDLVDVDTPARDDDSIELFRGVKTTQDKPLNELNREHGLGAYWSGDLHVSRLYSIRGLTSINTPHQLYGYDEEEKQIHDIQKSKTVPWLGVVFRYHASGKDVTAYNPESYAWEQEARIGGKHGSSSDPLAKRYPGLEIGFITGKDGRKVEWHKVTDEDEHKKLSEIMKQKPSSVSHISSIKKIDYEHVNVVQEGVLKGAKGKQVITELKKQEKKAPQPKISVSPQKQSYSTFMLSYQKGNEDGKKTFKDVDSAASFLKAEGIKGFNLFDPKGKVVLAGTHEGWKPKTSPPAEALKSWEKYDKLSPAKKKKMWKESKVTKPKVTGGTFTNFKAAYVKKFGEPSSASEGEKEFIMDKDHVTALTSISYAKAKFGYGSETTQISFEDLKPTWNTEVVQAVGHGESEYGYQKKLINKAVASLGGKKNVELHYPQLGSTKPLIVKHKSADACVAIAPKYGV